MNDRRAPIFVAVAAGLVLVLAVFFLVLPKRHQVSEARASLETVQQETAQLQAQVAALNAAKANAPEANKDIRDVNAELPLTVDEPGLLRLLKNSVEDSGIEFADISVSNPVLSSTGGFSTIPVTISLEGTYFSLAQFLYRIETLPRAAKALTGAISVGTSTSTGVNLAMQVSLELYTSDVSAGPGSEPGPSSQVGG